MDINDLKVENTNFIIEDGKFVIPDGIEQIKFDVGLSREAPNAAIWLDETPDRFVFGIEPLEYHWGHLYELGSVDSYVKHPKNMKIIQLSTNSVCLNGGIISDIDNRFCGLKCAIDDVEGIVKRGFYEFYYEEHLSGASSLLEPSSSHPLYVKHKKPKIKETVDINTISLSSILDYIDWDRFKYIEHIKTDCEGYDFIVIKSIGDYLERVVFITSEINNPLYWVKTPSEKEFRGFMEKKGFSIFDYKNMDIIFINNRFKDEIKKNNLNYKTLGL